MKVDNIYFIWVHIPAKLKRNVSCNANRKLIIKLYSLHMSKEDKMKIGDGVHVTIDLISFHDDNKGHCSPSL